MLNSSLRIKQTLCWFLQMVTSRIIKLSLRDHRVTSADHLKHNIQTEHRTAQNERS